MTKSGDFKQLELCPHLQAGAHWHQLENAACAFVIRARVVTEHSRQARTAALRLLHINYSRILLEATTLTCLSAASAAAAGKQITEAPSVNVTCRASVAVALSSSPG
jgi:hypothetical protein